VVLDENRENHMTWIIFQKKYNKKIFIDNVGVDEFCRDSDKIISYIQVGEQPLFTLYVNRNQQYKIVNKLNKLTIGFAVSNQKEKPKLINIQDFIVDNPAKFSYFDNIVCKPNNYKLQKFERNIWSGFKAQKVEVVDMSIVNVLLNHIREVWCCNNDIQYKYILSWFAQIIQTPYKKTGVALVLYGRQGTGKSLPLDIMLEYVFGKDISLATTGIGRLTGNFNNSLRGKLFTKCDEVSNINSGNENFHAVFDKMKDNITGNSLEIEQKGKDPLQIDNINNFVFTTNNSYSIKIEEDDRRYNPLEVSDKYKGNHEYFDNFLEVLSNDNAGNHILTYFLQYKELVDVRKIPTSDLKNDMIRKSKHNSIRFIEEGLDEIIDDINQNKNRNLEELYDWKDPDGNDAITVSNLYDFYINWTQQQHEKSCNKNIFSSNIKHLIKNNGKSQINKEQKRWVQF
jgi:phage/plasmid-associated DNA primase